MISLRARYWFPRLLSVAISMVVFSFLLQLSQETNDNQKIIGILVGLVTATVILLYYRQQNNDQLLSLLPLGLWLGVSAFFLIGGLSTTISWFQFVYLSVFTGIFTLLSYYSWKDPRTGGAIYLLIAAFYALVAWNKVEFYSLLFVIGTLGLTGGFYLAEPRELTEAEVVDFNQLESVRGRENWKRTAQLVSKLVSEQKVQEPGNDSQDD